MGALTHNGEVLQRLPADASQINFNKTGTDLNSTQTENAIKEVNTKVNNLGYCNVLNAEPITLAGDAELNNITNVGVYGGVLYPSNLGHSPEPSNANASQVKLLVSYTGSSLINSLEQQITIINNVSGANNTYKRQFLNNTWSDWTSYDKDIASLKSGLTNIVKSATASITTNVNGFLTLPAGKHVLSAYLAGYKSLIVTYSTTAQTQSAKWYIDNATNGDIVALSAETEYEVTYFYI